MPRSALDGPCCRHRTGERLRHAASLFLKAQHGALGCDSLRRREPGKLRPTSVKESARDKLAALFGLGNRCADCTLPGLAEGKVPGLACQRACRENGVSLG